MNLGTPQIGLHDTFALNAQAQAGQTSSDPKEDRLWLTGNDLENPGTPGVYQNLENHEFILAPYKILDSGMTIHSVRAWFPNVPVAYSIDFALYTLDSAGFFNCLNGTRCHMGAPAAEIREIIFPVDTPLVAKERYWFGWNPADTGWWAYGISMSAWASSGNLIRYPRLMTTDLPMSIHIGSMPRAGGTPAWDVVLPCVTWTSRKAFALYL